MKIQFEKNQQYQLDAIQSVVDVLEGQKLATTDFEFSLGDATENSLLLSEAGVGNNLTIAPEQILENIQTLQKSNELEPSNALEHISFKNDKGETTTSDFPNITIEMETGTGKTYVYLRTIYELNKVYGFKKFVIVVPSVAIREGTIKNLEITFEHFQEIYGNVPANFEVYDSKKLVRFFEASLNFISCS